jgi:hypothetical protein
MNAFARLPESPSYGSAAVRCRFAVFVVPQDLCLAGIEKCLVREICGALNVQRRWKLQVADRLSCQISYSGVFRQVRLTFPLRRFWSTEERAVRVASHHHVNPMAFLIAPSNA